MESRSYYLCFDRPCSKYDFRIVGLRSFPEEELNSGIENDEEKKYGLVQAFKLLVKNKYYMMICGTYICSSYTVL